MKLLYSSRKLEKECNDEKIATKLYGKTVAEKILATLQFLESAVNLNDISAYKPFYFEALYKDNKIKEGTYSLRLGAKTGYRLLMYVLDDNENIILNDAENSLYDKAVYLKLVKISNHYE